jgi:hypothetical protein
LEIFAVNCKKRDNVVSLFARRAFTSSSPRAGPIQDCIAAYVRTIQTYRQLTDVVDSRCPEVIDSRSKGRNRCIEMSAPAAVTHGGFRFTSEIDGHRSPLFLPNAPIFSINADPLAAVTLVQAFINARIL